MSRFRPLAVVVLACAVAALTAAFAAASPAHAAGRCGDPLQRPWCDTSKSPDERAGLLLAALTRDERISLLGGDELLGAAGLPGTHTGTSKGVPRAGVPTVYFSDGPVGTRQGKATSMPSPMSLASTFDPDAAVRHAQVIGDEVKKKGNDVVFAPAVNMLRTPLNGRTFEYFGEDPYLSARLAVAWTKGVQATGVIGNVKHFAVNNQEGVGFRPPGALIGIANEGSRTKINSTVDERTLREIYLPQFEAAVKEGGVGTVMCAYPRVNGEWACQNKHLLTDILKEEWGFDGFVLTDYGAAKDTAPSLRNGLDLDIYPGFTYHPWRVEGALRNAEVSEEEVTEHVRRILRTLFAHGVFDRDAYVDDDSRIDKDAHHAAAGELSTEGAVLLENDGGLLPLRSNELTKVALIGPEADAIKNGGGSSQIDAYKTTTVRDALEAKLGSHRLVFDDGKDAARAAKLARGSDVAIVVVGDSMNEGNDKPCMGLNCGSADNVDRDALIEAVAAAQPRTVLVLQTGGPVLMPWRHEVPAILEAWYPGQNGGTAIAKLLLGEAEPGGRLPATFPVAEADIPTAGDPSRYPGVNDEVRYSEGVFIGYRWYDRRAKDVAYPFGHGLSYTTFAYDDLRREADGAGGVVVSARVTNTGARAGTAVPQLYVGQPDQPEPGVEVPAAQLKGFDRVRLAPGESARVTFTLDERAFSYWSVTAGGWRVASGCHQVMVGASSRDLPLRGAIPQGGAQCADVLAVPGGAAPPAPPAPPAQPAPKPATAPSKARCTRRTAVTITLPKGVRGAKVVARGKRVKLVRRNGRVTAKVDLRGTRADRVTVTVSARTAKGRKLTQKRRLAVCVRSSAAGRRR